MEEERRLATPMSEPFLIYGTKTLLGERDAWLAALGDERQASAHTIAAYERDLRQFMIFLTGFHARPAELADFSDLKPQDLRAFLASRRRAGAGARTLGRGLSGVRAFLRFLERKGLASSAGAKAMRAPKMAKSLPRPLSAPDAVAVTEEADAMASEPWIGARDIAVLTLLYGCGLRISEALSLPGDALLDADARSVTIAGKGGKMRLVPLLPVVHEAVAAYRRLCPYTLTPRSFAAQRAGRCGRRSFNGRWRACAAPSACRPRQHPTPCAIPSRPISLPPAAI